jgi:hypothetical protein
MPKFGKVSPTISWAKNPETDVAGYVIFIGLASGVYTAYPPLDVALTGTPNSPAWVLQNLQVNIQKWHYFVVKAYDASGNMSPPSVEVQYYISDPYTRETIGKVLAKRG